MRMSQQMTELVKKASAGNQKAFVDLCENMAASTMYMCRRQLANWHDAEDATQEIFIVLQKNIRNLQNAQAFEAWFNRVITTVCNRMRQKGMKHQENIPIEDVDESLLADTLDDLPQNYLEAFELQERIVALVDSLPYKHRQCVMLHYYQKLSYAQIADVMNCKQDDVKNNLRRARQIMKVELADEQVQNAKLFSASPLIAIGPALETIFQNSAVATIPAGAIKAALQGAGIYSAAALAATSAVQGLALWQGVLTAVKIAALTLVVTAGSAAAVFVADGVANPPLSTPPANTSDINNFPQEVFSGSGNGDENKPPQAANLLSGRVYIENSSLVDPNARSGLEGAVLQLLSAEDNTVIATQTSMSGINHGIYWFTDIATGNYRLKLQLPPGAQPTNAQQYTQAEDGALWLLQDGSDTFSFDEENPHSFLNIDLALRFTASISGSVVLQAGAAAPPISLPDITVSLIDPQGRVLAQTPMAATGQYVFQNPAISQSGAYSLRYSLTGAYGISMPYQVLSLQLQPGQSLSIPSHVLQDTQAPELVINISGPHSIRHFNPSHIEVIVADATPVSLEWYLANNATAAIAGSGSTNTQLAAAVDALPMGSYTLHATARDQAGNEARATQLITINR